MVRAIIAEGLGLPAVSRSSEKPENEEKDMKFEMIDETMVADMGYDVVEAPILEGLGSKWEFV
jgi:hypothetical protein